MKLIKTSEARCLLYSAAMILDVEPTDILQYLRVDDTAQTEHQMQRGLHIMEIQEYAYTRGYGLVEYQYRPVLATCGEIPVSYEPWLTHDGIVVGVTASGTKHAVAWCVEEQKEYNPTGVDVIAYETFYALVQLYRGEDESVC